MSGRNREKPPSSQEAALSMYLDGLLASGIDCLQQRQQAPEHPPEQMQPSGDGPVKDQSFTESEDLAWNRIDAPRSASGDKDELAIVRFRLGSLCFSVPAQQIVATSVLRPEDLDTRDRTSQILGVLKLSGRTVSVVDTAEIILPGKGINQGYAHLLLLASGNEALACHSVDEPIVIPKAEVRWRDDRGSRPWLLGMMTDPPCPVIDMEVLVAELAGDPASL